MATATFAQVKAKAEKDKAFLGQLIVDPSKALKGAGLDVADPRDAKRIELFVKLSQENIRSAGRVVGIVARESDWGIGAGCCNGRVLMPGADLSRFGGER